MDRAVPSIRSRVWVQGMCEHTYIHTYIQLLHPACYCIRPPSWRDCNLASKRTATAKATARQGRVREHTKTTHSQQKARKRSIKGGSDPALPDHGPDQKPARTPPPRSPTPTPTAAEPSPATGSAIRRGAAGRGPEWPRGGADPATSAGRKPARRQAAVPFFIAAFVPRAVGFNGVVTGRREWDQAAGLERLACAAAAAHPATRGGLTLKLTIERWFGRETARFYARFRFRRRMGGEIWNYATVRSEFRCVCSSLAEGKRREERFLESMCLVEESNKIKWFNFSI
jgi:hypothetical protein